MAAERNILEPAPVDVQARKPMRLGLAESVLPVDASPKVLIMLLGKESEAKTL